MAHRIVILGGGTGGTLVANRLQRRLGERGRDHGGRPRRPPPLPARACCSCRSASPSLSEIVRSRREQLRAGIDFRLAEVERVDLRPNTRPPRRRSSLAYDVLVIATGATLHARGNRGPAGPPGARPSTPSTRSRARARCAQALRDFDGGPARGERGRHADQVPGGAAGVLLPRRLAAARAGTARAGRAHLRHAARRRLHQAGRLRSAWRAAGGEADRRGGRVRNRARRRRGATS